jgi:hypothetical protein
MHVHDAWMRGSIIHCARRANRVSVCLANCHCMQPRNVRHGNDICVMDQVDCRSWGVEGQQGKNKNQSDSIYWSERQREAAIRIFNCTGCVRRACVPQWVSMLYKRPRVASSIVLFEKRTINPRTYPI